MQKIVLTYGSIIGAVLAANMLVMVQMMYNDPEFMGNEVLGFSIMFLLFALIFVAVRKQRANQGGFISFWEALKTGLLISLLASTIYVVTWLVAYYLFVPDFFDQYMACTLKNTPAEDQAAKIEEMNGMKEMYQNPVWVVLFTYMEVLPIGIVMSLIGALIFKKTPKAIVG